eukprot:s3_g40.t1
MDITSLENSPSWLQLLWQVEEQYIEHGDLMSKTWISISNTGVWVEQQAGGSMLIGGEPRGWLSDGALRALPKPLVAGVCLSCRQALTQDAFARSARRRLRSGASARCEACTKAEELRERRRSDLGAGLYAFGSSWWPAILTLVGASLATIYAWPDVRSPHIQSASPRFFVAVGSLLAAFCLKRWLLRCLGGFEGEPTLEAKPLLLVGEGEKTWERCVDDAWCRSFAHLRRCPFTEEQLSRWWDAALTQTQWQQPALPNGRSLPRSAAWFVRKGCSCSYEYNATAWPAVEVPDWLSEVEDAVWDALCTTGVERPNSCVANLYADGMESVDWHADNEPLFEGLLGDCRIVSLSLGETRRFDLRRRRGLSNPQHHPERVSVDLQHGDLITMEGCFQKHWYHRVPKAGGVTRPRINLTWRSIRRHHATCPLAKKKNARPRPSHRFCHVLPLICHGSSSPGPNYPAVQSMRRNLGRHHSHSVERERLRPSERSRSLDPGNARSSRSAHGDANPSGNRSFGCKICPRATDKLERALAAMWSVASLWTGRSVVSQHLEQEPSLE